MLAICMVLQFSMDISFHIQEEKLVRSYVKEDILVNFEHLKSEEQKNIQTIQQKVENLSLQYILIGCS